MSSLRTTTCDSLIVPSASGGDIKCAVRNCLICVCHTTCTWLGGPSLLRSADAGSPSGSGRTLSSAGEDKVKNMLLHTKQECQTDTKYARHTKKS